MQSSIFDTHGIEIPGQVKVNLEKMMNRKQSVVDQTTVGIDFLMKKIKLMFTRVMVHSKQIIKF